MIKVHKWIKGARTTRYRRARTTRHSGGSRTTRNSGRTRTARHSRRARTTRHSGGSRTTRHSRRSRSSGYSGDQGPQGIPGNDGLLPNGTAIGNTTFWNGTEWVVDNSNIFNAGSNIGIGLTTPTSKLHLYGTSNNAADITSETDASRIIKHWFKNTGQIGP